jgi:peptide deformylase
MMGTRLNIKKYGDSVLRKKSDDIISFNIYDDYIRNLAFDMLKTMYAASGIGLAAPQVGVSLRLCVIDVSPYKKSSIIMLNPKILFGENKVSSKEGCLSLPGFYEPIKRFDIVFAEYMDLRGKKIGMKAHGFLAKALQHEIDHLDAKIFIDYLPLWKRKNIEKEIKRKKKAGYW